LVNRSAVIGESNSSGFKKDLPQCRQQGRVSLRSVFHRYSSVLGVCASTVVLIAVGAITHWRAELTLVYCGIGLASLWCASRIFYGLKESADLDKAAPDADSLGQGGAFGLRVGFGEEQGRRLVNAYDRARAGDPTELTRIAYEEQSE
jgi:hypothetical protein